MANLPDTRWNSSTVLIAAPGKAIKRERDDSTLAEPPPERKRARITRKECIICVDDVAANQFPKKPHAGYDEQHTSDVYFKCYNQHISTGVDHKGSELVRCPQCPQKLTEPEVRKLARVATYQKYIDDAAKKCMQKEEEFHACPNADCTWGAFFAKDDGNILNCQLCYARYCLSCQVPFHEGQLCEEYLAQRAAIDGANEQKSLDAVQKMSKKCPSASCGVNIEKISGCDHITCRVCRHEFCWLCFASYSGRTGIHTVGNSAHQAACPYFRANPSVAPTMVIREEHTRRAAERLAFYGHMNAELQAFGQVNEQVNAQRRATYDARVTEEEAHAHDRGPPVRHTRAPPVHGSRSRGRLRDPSID